MNRTVRPTAFGATAVHYKGRYLMRTGDVLVPMTDKRLREIFAEAGSDFSAEVCADAAIADLDSEGIEEFRRLWVAQSGNEALAHLSQARLLEDALGEMGLQYHGIRPDDPRLEPYYAAAEELGIPVALHTGLGPPGAPHTFAPRFSVALGRPILLEPVLKRHPELRAYLMHAG